MILCLGSAGHQGGGVVGKAQTALPPTPLDGEGRRCAAGCPLLGRSCGGACGDLGAAGGENGPGTEMGEAGRRVLLGA